MSTEQSISDRLLSEGMLPLAEAYRRANVPLSIWTAMRHCRVGVAVDGRRIHLESVRVGRRWFTSVAAVRRFFARAGEVRGPADSGRDAERAAGEAYLESIGLGRDDSARGGPA